MSRLPSDGALTERKDKKNWLQLIFAVLFMTTLVVALFVAMDHVNNEIQSPKGLEDVRKAIAACPDPQLRSKAEEQLAQYEPKQVTMTPEAALANGSLPVFLLTVLLLFLKEAPKVIWNVLMELFKRGPRAGGSENSPPAPSKKALQEIVDTRHLEVRVQQRDAYVQKLHKHIGSLRNGLDAVAAAWETEVDDLRRKLTRRSRYKHAMLLAILVCFAFPIGLLVENVCKAKGWTAPPPDISAFIQTIAASALALVFTVAICADFNAHSVSRRWWHAAFIGFVGCGIPGWFPAIAVSPAVFMATTPSAWTLELPGLGTVSLAEYLLISRCVWLPCFGGLIAVAMHFIQPSGEIPRSSGTIVVRRRAAQRVSGARP